MGVWASRGSSACAASMRSRAVSSLVIFVGLNDVNKVVCFILNVVDLVRGVWTWNQLDLFALESCLSRLICGFWIRMDASPYID